VETGKNNRIEQTPFHDLNLPANPHDYWLFGGVDFQTGNMISSQPRYDHFDTAADMSTRMCDVRLIRIPDFQPKIKRQPDISSGRRYFLTSSRG